MIGKRESREPAAELPGLGKAPIAAMPGQSSRTPKSQTRGQLGREDLGLLGKIFGPDPVAGLHRLAGGVGESPDFGHQILLHGIQMFARGEGKISFGNIETMFAVVFCGLHFLRRDFRRDDRLGPLL